MARYKDYSYDQGKFLPVSFDRVILPGNFEYTLNHLIEHDVVQTRSVSGAFRASVACRVRSIQLHRTNARVRALSLVLPT
jgi:hypothetical protein